MADKKNRNKRRRTIVNLDIEKKGKDNYTILWQAWKQIQQDIVCVLWYRISYLAVSVGDIV